MGIKSTQEAAAAQKRARCILWVGPRQKQRERKGRRSVLVTDNKPRMRREGGKLREAEIQPTAVRLCTAFGLCALQIHIQPFDISSGISKFPFSYP